ncbi:helix-turn-helix transcriptional regulator [Streptococcus ruminicola]|uniref:helix-turn-helix domain-containing protein n=1 Tax=Streptococcus ruminicola TaxID=2686210 RepID=UPI003F5E682C
MNRLKELRKEKKLTQQELADYMQVTRRGYQKWENGESQIKPDKADKLATFFGVSTGYLLGFNIDEVSEGEIEFHNSILNNIEKELYIRFLDFLTSANLTLTNKQIKAFFNQLVSMSDINDSYRRLEKDTNNLNILFSISDNYIPNKKIGDILFHEYQDTVEKQIEMVDKILND